MGLRAVGATSLAHAGHWALVEREHELARIAGELAGARGCVLVIRGPAGVGKTRLLEAAQARAADAGLAVLRARGAALETGFGFGVARQLLEPTLRALDARARERVLSGAAALAAPLLGAGGGAGGLSSVDPTHAAIHGLYWLVANLAERAPLALTIDDAQWADAESLRWLVYLARRIGELPAALVLTVRSDEPRSDAEALAELARGFGAAPLAPRPLSTNGSAELVRRSLGRAAVDALCASCHAVTGGNPLLLSQLLAALVEEGVRPDENAAARIEAIGARTLAPYVLARLARLGEPAVALARAAAVLDASAPLRHAARLAGLGLEAAAAAGDRLARAEILAPGPAVTFAHPLLREAVADDLGAHRRAAAHGRAARLLHADGVAAERVAAHLMLALPEGDAEAITVLRTAAADAVARGAPGAAAAYLSRALAEAGSFAGRSEVLLELGRIEVSLTDPAAERHLREAVGLDPSPHIVAAASALLAQPLVYSGRELEGVALLDAAARAVEALDPDLALLLDAMAIAAARTSVTTQTVGRERAAHVSPPRACSTPGERAMLATLSALALIDNEHARAACEYSRRALGAGALVRDVTCDSPLPYLAMMAPTWGDDLATAERELALVLEDSRRRGSLFGARMTACNRSQARVFAGRLAEAEADARFDLEHAVGPILVLDLLSLATLVQVCVERGRLDAADAELAAHPVPPELQRFWSALLVRLAVARLRLAQGRARDALAELRAVGDAARGTFRSPAFMPWRSETALALLALGESLDEARALAAEELALAEAFGAARAIGVALRAKGLLAGGEEGIGLLRAAVDTLTPSPARLEHARALTDLGAALRRAGGRAESREPLRAALDLAHRCGATALADRAEAELRAAGARPRSVVRSGLDALTPSQRRVAELAAGGMSNREIAQALFITTKTVETHMAAIFRTLDVRSRRDLPGALTIDGAPGSDL